MENNRISLKKLHVLIPENLFRELQETGILYDNIDERVANFLYDCVEKKKNDKGERSDESYR